MRSLAFAVCIAVLLAPNAVGKNIALGTDYFSTAFGTKVDFGPPIGIVYFKGGPPCAGTADTRVERQADAVVSPGGTAAPIPIQIVCLSLQSISPVSMGGTFYNVFVKLDPANLSHDTGTMTISENTDVIGGTFTSSLAVYFEADFVPVSSGPSFPVFGHQTFTNPGAPWARGYPRGTCLVTGPVGDQAANKHTHLGPNREDFFVVKILTESQLLNSHRVHLCKTDLDADDVENVELGTDYYATQSGTHINFGPGIGDVQFTGRPIVGTADTVIQRRLDAIVSPGGTAATIPVQMVGLSLQSTAPVQIGATFYNVFVELDPAHLAQDTGHMIISENVAGTGGRFRFNLIVFYEADFVPVSGGTGFSLFNQLRFRKSGTRWSSTPPGGIMIVPGPDDGSSAEEFANLHSGLGPNEKDFFPVGVFDECVTRNTGGCSSADHRLRLAPMP
jgi:hypothetical protein